MKEGWQTTSIGRLIEPVETTDPTKGPDSCFAYVDVSSVNSTSFAVEASTLLRGKEAPSRARRRIREGDVLFATIRPTLRRVAMVPQELDDQVCSTGYMVLRALKQIERRYLFYYAISDRFIDQMAALERGASYPAVSDTNVRDASIPLPPLEEQQAIVDKLDRAFAGLETARANAEANLENAKELFQNYLDLKLIDDKDLLEWIPIGNIAAVKGGKRLPKGCKTQHEPTDYPYLSVRDFTEDGSIEASSVKFITKEVHKQISRYTISNKDVFVSIAGTIGKAGIVPAALDGANLTENAAKLVLSDDWDKEYVLAFLQSSSFALAAVKQTKTAAQPKLALSRLASIELPKRAKAEQKTIVQKLSKMREHARHLESEYTRQLSDLDELKQSLLQKAFAGELT